MDCVGEVENDQSENTCMKSSYDCWPHYMMEKNGYSKLKRNLSTKNITRQWISSKHCISDTNTMFDSI